MMASLAASLLAMIFVANVPIDVRWAPVGWQVVRPSEPISVDFVKEQGGSSADGTGAPVTRFEPVDEPEPIGESIEAEKNEQVENEHGEASAPPPLERLRGRRIFEAAHDMPQIIGGIGAYYIHIEYPEEAVREGIEGRLVLSFVVEVDGHTSEVEVVSALHPACDSAAVRALRQTRFVPGRQNGEIVPVRMRLPVRFQIVDEGERSNGTSS